MLNARDVTEVRVSRKAHCIQMFKSVPRASGEASSLGVCSQAECCRICWDVLQNYTKIVFSDAQAPAKYLITPGEAERRQLICLVQVPPAAAFQGKMLHVEFRKYRQ